MGNTTKSGIEFDNLPLDILPEILKHLDSARDLARCAMVNKTWNRMVKKHQELHKNVCLKEWDVRENDIICCANSWKSACQLGSEMIQSNKLKKSLDDMEHFLLISASAIHFEKRCLVALPASLFAPHFVEQLCYLDLSRNRLQVVPPAIGTLTALKTLYLDRNLLEGALTSVLCNLVNLERLDIQENYIESLPDKLGSLRRLKYFYVSQNKIKEIPQSLKSRKDLNIVGAKFQRFYTPVVIAEEED